MKESKLTITVEDVIKSFISSKDELEKILPKEIFEELYEDLSDKELSEEDIKSLMNKIADIKVIKS